MSLSVYERTKLELFCGHRSTELRVKYNKAGARMFRVQCTQCGEVVSSPHLSTLTPEEVACARDFDEDAQQQRRDEFHEHYQALSDQEREAEKQAFQQRHALHMQSRKWKFIRSQVISRAKGLCEGCGVRKAVQAHHLTYDHLGDEFLWELKAVCLECHDRLHGR